MTVVTLDRGVDHKKELLDRIGDISKFEIFNNQLLAAVYIRPEKTKGGIYLRSEEHV